MPPSPLRTNRWIWAEPIAILVMALAINLAGNDRTGLWDRDEPRYAVAVREMRQSGDWLLPSFNGEPRYHKPILIYWLMGLTTAMAGDNPFAARLVSATAGASAVLGVWWLGRRMFGARCGTLAALAYATAPIVAAEAKLATTDATLALWLLGCQAALWVLSHRESPMAAAFFWTGLNLAFLTKGPVGLAFVGVSAMLARWWGWTWPSLRRLHLKWGLASFVLLTLPWFAAATIASRGEFLRFAVGDQILRRVSQDVETHGGFPGYYATVSAVVFYPWSALLPVGIAVAWARRRSDPTLAYLLGWIAGPMILLECFRTKLIHYYLPAFPSCALLVAWAIVAMADRRENIRGLRLGRLSVAMLATIGAGLALALIGAAVILSGPLFGPLIVLAGLIAVGTVAGVAMLRRGQSEQAIFALAGCWAIVLILATGWVIPIGEPARTSRVVGRKLGELSRSLAIEPVLLEYQEPGIVYELGHPIALIRDRDGFFRHISGGRSVATVLLDFEIPVMRSHFGLDVEVVEEIDGYRLTKGKKQALYLAIVKEANSPSVDDVPNLATSRRGVGEQPLVK